MSLKFSKLFVPNLVWSMALYSQEVPFHFEHRLRNPPLKVFSSKRLRRSVDHVHTRADPFLYAYNDELFLLFESKAIGKLGCIAAYKTSDLVRFDNLGIILKESHHLSYPMVFNSKSGILMIPEAGSSGETFLYSFDSFPYRPKKARSLLRGEYWDPSAIFYQNHWYLFVTSRIGLELFHTDDIENGLLSPHPNSPLTTDKRISRCGGAPLIVDGVLYRIAQDCSARYGGNLNVLRVLELSPESYREQLAYENYFNCTEEWNREGGHHISIATFKCCTVVAVDGHHRDFLTNKFMSPVFQTLAKFKSKSLQD